MPAADPGPAIRREIVCLLPHSSARELLVTADGTVPSTAIDGDYEVAAVLDAVERLLGVLPPVLRLDDRRSDADGEPTFIVADLEALPGDVPPTGFAWRSWADPAIADGAAPEVRDALPRWIARREHGPMPADPPWAVAGWSARVEAWIRERMAADGHPATAAPRLWYGWGISSVWRAPSDDGLRYFKCSAPIFPAEASVTAAIATRTPELVTSVVAFDGDENWLLMRDHGERLLGREPASTWGVGLDALATIQRAWMDHTADLAAAGALDRTLEVLAAEIPGLAEREPLAGELTPGERAAWDAAVPAFVEACRRLEAIGPPPTLTHGDFHPWNVAVTPSGPLVFDWTDAAVGHPFGDLAVFVTRGSDIDHRRRLRDRYLAHWADTLAPDTLAEAGELSLVTGTLQQAAAYVRLLSGLEPEDGAGMVGAARSWALAAVDTLEHGIATRRPGHADG